MDEGGKFAAPEVGDDVGLVRNGGAYWWQQYTINSCDNPFPLYYGQRLRGVPFDYGASEYSSVKAKPLLVGEIYEVGTNSPGSNYGSGWFRIRPDRRVENFKADPTTPVQLTEDIPKNASQ